MNENERGSGPAYKTVTVSRNFQDGAGMQDIQEIGNLNIFH